MSIRNHVLVDSSTSSFGCPLNMSPLNKTLSTRSQVSRNRYYGPSGVPSASKMKQRISEAFGSGKNILYSDQHPHPGVPETSLPAQCSSSPLDPPRSLVSSSPSPSKRATGRRRIPSSLPPSSPPPPSSSGDGETEEPACFPHRDTRKIYEPEDPYGLLRGHQKFTRLRRHRRRQKIAVAAPPKRIALGCLENLSPATPCANSNASPGQRLDSRFFPGARYGKRNHPDGGADGGRQGDHGGNRNGNGNTPDPDGNGGAAVSVSGPSETLSDLLARLPRGRGRRPLLRQDQESRATSVLTTAEPSKTAGEKKRKEQQKKKRADNEASHLKGDDRVVRKLSI